MYYTVLAEESGSSWVLRCVEIPTLTHHVDDLDNAHELMREAIGSQRKHPVDGIRIALQLPLEGL